MDRRIFAENELKNWKGMRSLDIPASFDVPEEFKNTWHVYATKNEMFVNLSSEIDDQTNQQKIGDKIIFEKLVGKRIDLVFKNFVHAVPEKKFVDCCNYDIVLHGLDEIIGTCSAKLGFNDVLFFIGNVSYRIDENYRGNGYAGEAVGLLKQLFKANHFDKIYITNVPDNNSLRRVCEKIGARFLGTFEIPEDHIRRKEFGERYMNIFELKI